MFWWRNWDLSSVKKALFIGFWIKKIIFQKLFIIFFLKITMPKYVIQEHHASHLHWDFRLEMNGVLKSWALPKKPPRSKTIKRLAIQVEDHLRSYADFEGEIEEGYGKGTVKIWDKGTYRLIEKTPKKIEFELKGKILQGKYVLIKAEIGDDKKNWLLIKV